MHLVLPSTKQHWVYDDPSGVLDRPTSRPPVRGPRIPVWRPVRFVHQDC
jgi:hypothetical protein